MGEVDDQPTQAEIESVCREMGVRPGRARQILAFRRGIDASDVKQSGDNDSDEE